MGFGQSPGGIGHFLLSNSSLVGGRIGERERALPPASQPTREGFVFSSVRIGHEFTENAGGRAIASAPKPIHPGVVNRILTAPPRAGGDSPTPGRVFSKSNRRDAEEVGQDNSMKAV